MQEFVSALQAALAQLLTDLGQHEAALAWFQGWCAMCSPSWRCSFWSGHPGAWCASRTRRKNGGSCRCPGAGASPSAIGRTFWAGAAAADIRLNLPTVSRQHAALIRGDEGEWQVTDLGSKAGTQGQW